MSDNADQAEFWTVFAGEKWVRLQNQIDPLMSEVTQGMFARADIQKGQSVLDIGCGTGESSMVASDHVGRDGQVLGVDISPTMLARAQQRTQGLSQVSLIEADASAHEFETEAFDWLISRFGMMFFSEPVIAFRNISKALAPGAQVSFACWGAIAHNPWFTIPARAAKAQLGAPPSVDPDDPGPFAFREPNRVLGILQDAGFQDALVDVAEIALTPSGTVVEAAALSTNLGPAMRTLQHFEGSKEDAASIIDRTAKAFDSFDTADGLRIPAEINFCTARMPG